MTGPTVTILQGDVLDQLRTLPDESVHCVVTSPPYWGLRDYGVEGQIGMESTIEEYINKMVGVFHEAKRVLRKDGTLWVNMGDSYASGGYATHNKGAAKDPANCPAGWSSEARGQGAMKTAGVSGLKQKDLVGQPWRLALALQADGWYLRSDIIWSKPNPMPESCTDRPTKAHEYIFLLTKSPNYFYDNEAIREPVKEVSLARAEYGWDCDRDSTKNASLGGKGIHVKKMGSRFVNPAGRNARTVWEIATQSYSDAHFATFPEELPRRCIKAGTSERGCCSKCGAPWERQTDRTPMVIDRSERTHEKGRTRSSGTMVEPPTSKTTGYVAGCQCGTMETIPRTVLDVFAGSGTTGMVARGLGISSILIELNPEYVKLIRDRTNANVSALDFFAESVSVIDPPEK